MTVRPGDDPDTTGNAAGFAYVVAVASILVFALFALGVIAATRREVMTGGAEVERARAGAAADAGMALAISGLVSESLTDHWSIDGRSRQLSFEGARLEVRVIDERGKVPLNLLDEHQLTLLLEQAGMAGERLRIAHDSFLDWIDDDDEPRADGAEVGFYRSRGVRPRNGYLQSTGELRQIRGFDATVVRRIESIATVDFGNGPFDARFAQPAAIAVMSEDGEGGPRAIEQAREAAGQVTALGFVGEADRTGRPLTIAVRALLPGGAEVTRRCIVELTGVRLRPYVTRYCS